MATDRVRVDLAGAPRIAVVDDDLTLRKLMTAMLARKGYDARPFADGKEALAAVKEGGYRLVVSDVDMPRLDGLGLTAAIRERFEGHQLPILLVSVHDEEDLILRTYEAGANDYLVKPFRMSVLAAKVQALLREPAPSELPEWERGRALPARFERWVLEKELGRGGMGVVFAGRRGDGTVEAVKVLHASRLEDRAALARFFREAEHMREIESPHLVRYVAAGLAKGHPYLAMGYVAGRTAHEVVTYDGPLPVAQALAVARDVCLGLAVLHERGLVHRDVKPANVLLGPDGRAVLVDLGLVKGRVDETVTSVHEIMGTAEFLAPEVIHGDAPDAASDLYALGATLYFLLSGELPITGSSPLSVITQTTSGRPAPPLRERRRVPLEVEELVASLLSADLTRRPDDASVVAEHLVELLARPPRPEVP